MEPRAERTSDPHVGLVLDERYRVLRKIGGGGMGAVYEAEHEVLHQRVALKVMHTALVTEASAMRRFFNEARAAAMLGHPGILRCIDAGHTPDGAPFLVLELLEGRDLEAELRERGALPIGEAVRITLEVARAVDTAHRAGIVHRDLKPDNVFLLARPGDGGVRTKVLDFGVSKFTDGLAAGPPTKTGSVLGTPHYMAPEQIHDSSKADARADVYGLGAVLYQMLAGRMPFEAPALPMLVMRILSQPPPPLAARRPDVPAGLLLAVDRALAKLPSERFASMDELAAAIEPYADIDDPPVVAPADVDPRVSIPTPAPARMGPDALAATVSAPDARRRRNAVLMIGGGLALIGLILITWWLIEVTRALN